MIKRLRSRKWIVFAMVVMFVLAVIFWMYAVSGFSLSFAACDGTFSLDAKLLRCRRPVVFLWLFWLCIAAGASFGVAAMIRFLIVRRRQRVESD